MNKEHGIIEAELIAKNTWEGLTLDPVAPLRGEAVRRDITIQPSDAVLFHFLLEQYITCEKMMLGPTSAGRQELEKLEGIEKSFGKRKIFERRDNGKVRLEKVILSGDQVATIYDFIEDYPFDQDRISKDSRLSSDMKLFCEGLSRQYPISPAVRNEDGKIKGIINKFTRQGR